MLVAILLEDTGTSLQRLELVGLRSITGDPWMVDILQRCDNLTSLDLSGCANLDPRLFQTAIESCSLNMTHLNLTCCRRMDKEAVIAIAKKWKGLETLQLGGCSQTIDDECLDALADIRLLRTLDLSGLKRIENCNEQLYLLPASLECLSLSGCERVNFSILIWISNHVHHLFEQRLGHESDLQALAELVRSGNIEEVWSVLYAALSESIREIVDNVLARTFESVFQSGWLNLRVSDLSHCGKALGSGIPIGALGFIACFSGGSLREVNVSGCDNVTNEDIQMLAATCSDSLTCLEARACRIGDSALIALGKECNHLAFLDVSA